MANRTPAEIAGAICVVIVAVAAAAVIGFGFLAPETMLDTVGVEGLFVAIIAMIGCAVVANLYDLRGILADALR